MQELLKINEEGCQLNLIHLQQMGAKSHTKLFTYIANKWMNDLRRNWYNNIHMFSFSLNRFWAGYLMNKVYIYKKWTGVV